MHLIFLSPHLDDAVYSSGGLIWKKADLGDVLEIWTICAGDPPVELTSFAEELHQRWGTGGDAVHHRREEDAFACSILGVRFRHLHYQDCIYRRIPGTGEPVITENDDLFKPVREEERILARQIARDLLNANTDKALMFCPLGIGGHVDHRLTRMAAEFSGLPLAYYADFPYSRDVGFTLSSFLPGGYRQVVFDLDEDALHHWTLSMAAYGSQMSSFWVSEAQMVEEVRAYAQTPAGSSYWLKSAYSQNQ